MGENLQSKSIRGVDVGRGTVDERRRPKIVPLVEDGRKMRPAGPVYQYLILCRQLLVVRTWCNYLGKVGNFCNPGRAAHLMLFPEGELEISLGKGSCSGLAKEPVIFDALEQLFLSGIREQPVHQLR